MTPADFAAHVLAPGIMNESDGDATITTTDDGLVVRTGPGDEYRIVVMQLRPEPLCRCGHPEREHLWPTCWGCNRRTGESFSCEAGEGDEFCDCKGFVPIEEGE